MTKEELKALIKSDLEASAMFAVGNDSGCAERCIAIAPKVRVSMTLTERGLLRELGPAIAESVLQKLEGFANNEQPFSPIVKRFLKWMEPANGGADFGDSQTIAMAQALTAGGVFTQEEFDAIDGLSMVRPTITTDQVSEVRNG